MTRTRSSAMYVTIFTIISFVFYLLLGLSRQKSPDSVLAVATALAVVTAFTAALSYASRAYMHRLAFSGKKQAAATMDTHQQRTVEIDLAYDDTFDLALDALSTLHQQPLPVPGGWMNALARFPGKRQLLTMYRTDRDAGQIEAGLRSRVLGIPDVADFSRIEFTLEKIDALTTRVHISSKANTLFDLYDLGKNLHYVNHLALYLRRESQQMSAESRLSDNAADDEAVTPDAGLRSDELKR